MADSKKRKNPNYNWTEEELARLKQVFSAGFSKPEQLIQLANLKHVPYQSVYYQIQKLLGK